MSNRHFTLAAVVTLITIGAASTGCSGEHRFVAPTEPSAPAALTITSVTPDRGLAGFSNSVQVLGSGFQSGATVTMDGIAVTKVTVVNSTTIRVSTPFHSPGRVDVRVVNPDGQSATASGAYLFDVVTLTVSLTEVAPGAPLIVSWVAPGRNNPAIDGDWIGLYRIADWNQQHLWDSYTTGSQGTFSVNAPLVPGEYEFRYLVDDGFVDVAHTKKVTVSAPSPNAER